MKNLFSKGFTLIELLVVIAVLGVLASVVLVALNPAEQLKRGRDASRLQEVAQLGHAATAFFTAQGEVLDATSNTAYTAANWQTQLVNSGNINAVITAPAIATYPTGGVTCTISGTGSKEGNICYAPNGTSNFLVWTAVESTQYNTKAAAAASCTASSAYFIYDSTQGKAGVACANNSGNPSAGLTLK